MCDQCLTFPCQDRCPNGREGEVAVCDFCGEPLLAGDAYLRFGQVRFCMDCAEGMTAREALELGFDVDLHMFESAEDWIEKFHAKGLRVAIWTANTPAQVSYALSLGVDFIESDFFSGITTPYV